MAGFGDDAAKQRLIRGAEVNNQQEVFLHFLEDVEHHVRDPVLVIREEVVANAGGVYEVGDLAWLDGKIAQVQSRLAALSESFNP